MPADGSLRDPGYLLALCWLACTVRLGERCDWIPPAAARTWQASRVRHDSPSASPRLCRPAAAHCYTKASPLLAILRHTHQLLWCAVLFAMLSMPQPAPLRTAQPTA